MAKKSKNPLILVGVIVALVAVGVAVYALQKDEQNNQTPAQQSNHCTTNNGTFKKEQCTNDYVGLSVSEAANKARENELAPKTIKRDGKAQGFTDEGPAIYFEIENGTVTKAYFEENRPQ